MIKQLVWMMVVGITVLVLSACGVRPTQSGAVVVPSPSPTLPPATPSPSPSPPPTCPLPLSASATVLTAANDIQINQPVEIKIEASRCADDSFHIQGRAPTETFSSSVVLTKTYAVSGVVGETLIVEAWDPELTVAAESKAVSVVLTVLPAIPVAPLTCSVDRIPGQVINSLNEPLPLKINTSGPVTSTTLNGSPATVGIPIAVSPTAPNSGTYTATVQVTDGVNQATCQNTFLTPVCSHNVLTVSTQGTVPKMTVKTATTLSGPIMQVELNGEVTTALPVPPSNILYFTNTLPYGAGIQTSVAKAFAPLGDTISCTANYVAPYPLDPILLPITTYASLYGFSVESAQSRAVAGFGTGASVNEWKYQAVQYAMPILEPGANAQFRIGQCHDNEVMVGKPAYPYYSYSLSMVMCSNLRNDLALRNTTRGVYLWAYNAWYPCPGPQVMTGMLFSEGYLETSCAEIYQK